LFRQRPEFEQFVSSSETCDHKPNPFMSEGKQGLVFISCGQYHPEEIQLGLDLAAAVNEMTPFEGYFAQSRTSLEGLSHNIFGALNRCCGFVGMMHYTGEAATPNGKHVRGSVWIEQEIGIAAFLKQAQGRDIQVVVYIQRASIGKGTRTAAFESHRV
jgi:hypothetical protein